MSRQPSMFGGPVDQDLPGRKPFRTRRLQLEFADHFDAQSLALPPLDKRAKRLRFEGEPVAYRQVFKAALEFPQRRLDGGDGEKIEGGGLASQQRPDEG